MKGKKDSEELFRLTLAIPDSIVKQLDIAWHQDCYSSRTALIVELLLTGLAARQAARQTAKEVTRANSEDSSYADE